MPTYKFIVIVTDNEDWDSYLTPSAYRFPSLRAARQFIESCEHAAAEFDLHFDYDVCKVIDMEV